MQRSAKFYRITALLVVWHSLFLPAGLAAPAKEITPEDRAWWAFQKVSRPATPEVKNARWARNPIDAFILAKLEAAHLQPAPPADKATLLRRAYLDLIR